MKSRSRLSMSTLDMEDAARILGILASEHDPIWFNGTETTIADLASDHPFRRAAKMTIMFWGSDSKGLRRRKGNVVTMIIDRLTGT